MSRIDELIERLCPDGVEYKALGKIAKYGRDRIPASKVSEGCYVGVNELLQEYRGRSYEVHYPAEERCIAFHPGDVLLGNIRPYLKKMWLADCEGGTNGDVLVIRINDTAEVAPEFLWQVLAGGLFTEYNIQHSKGAKMPRGDKKAILEAKIPVPPMEVQQEVVRVLDSFAELEAEMETELEARQRQFDYYVELLASSRDYPTKTIGHLCDVYTGGEAPVDCIKGNVSDDDHPYAVWANGRDVYGFAADYRIGKDAVCISSIGANTGAIFYHEANFTPIIRLKVLVPKTNEVLTRFLYYVMLTVKFGRKSGSVPNINASDVKRIEVPIPPLDVQREVIAKLDAFDNLVNGITDGIPAEIEARRKQYAYYRDMLLSFRKKVV